MKHDLLLDTHTLIWALLTPDKLSPEATAALEAAVASGGVWVVSAISLIELRYLIEKGKVPQEAWDKTMAAVDDPTGTVRVIPVDERVAVRLIDIPRDLVPDMPDRIIATTAAAHLLQLVTKDAKIRSVPELVTIW